MEQKQQSIVLPIDGTTKALIDAKLIAGYVISSVTNLNPSVDSLLVIYNKNLPVDPP